MVRSMYAPLDAGERKQLTDYIIRKYAFLDYGELDRLYGSYDRALLAIESNARAEYDLSDEYGDHSCYRKMLAVCRQGGWSVAAIASDRLPVGDREALFHELSVHVRTSPSCIRKFLRMPPSAPSRPASPASARSPASPAPARSPASPAPTRSPASPAPARSPATPAPARSPASPSPATPECVSTPERVPAPECVPTPERVEKCSSPAFCQLDDAAGCGMDVSASGDVDDFVRGGVGDWVSGDLDDLVGSEGREV